MFSAYAGTATFDVDLNSVRDGNRITTLLKHAVGGYLPQLEAGDWVSIRDEEHNMWRAVVDRMQGNRIELKIDWSFPAAESHEMISCDIFSVQVSDGLISRGDRPLVTS